MIGVRDAGGQVRDIKTGEVIICVDRAGRARPLSEVERVAGTLAAIKDAAEPPWQCGDRIPVAPARAQIERYQPTELVNHGPDDVRLEQTGYRGRDGARVTDVFDKMVNQAIRAHAASVQAYDRKTKEMRRDGKDVANRKAPIFVPPFTWGQVQIARDYAALTERCNSSGVKCSSLESLRQGGNGGGDREAAIFADFARLRALHRRIGDRLAKRLRRHRPSVSGPDPRQIMVQMLVDLVCLGGLSPKEILQANGWAGNSRQISDLRFELCMALDGMQGYVDEKAQNVP